MCRDVDGAIFGTLFTATLLSCCIFGSTYQWVVEKGLFRKDFLQKENQYNVLVGLSALTANLQAIGCFLHATLFPTDDTKRDAYGLTTALSINTLFMTHSSLMLVSRKVSLTYPNAEQTWQRLLRLNAALAPLSFAGAAIWATSYKYHDNNFNWARAHDVFLPCSIAIWAMAEASLSGNFVFQMSRYQWTAVMYKGATVLVFVALCDLLCLMLAISVGDVPAMCVWGLLYSVRVRLEVRVMNSMIEYIQEKRAATMYQAKKSNSRRRKKQKKGSSEFFGLSEYENPDSDAASVSSRGSLFSKMPTMTMIHPNDLTQLFKANFFNEVLTAGRIGRSLRSLASIGKKLGGKDAVCQKCGKHLPPDDDDDNLTIGSLRSKKSLRSLRSLMSGRKLKAVEFCECHNRRITENTVRESGSSHYIMSPPIREIRVSTVGPLDQSRRVKTNGNVVDDNDDSSINLQRNSNHMDSSNPVSDFGNSQATGLSLSHQSRSRRRLMRSLNLNKYSSQTHEEEEDEQEDEEVPLKGDNDDDSTRGSFVLRFSGQVVDLSDYVLSSDEEDDDSDSSDDDDTHPDMNITADWGAKQQQQQQKPPNPPSSSVPANQPPQEQSPPAPSPSPPSPPQVDLEQGRSYDADADVDSTTSGGDIERGPSMESEESGNDTFAAQPENRLNNATERSSTSVRFNAPAQTAAERKSGSSSVRESVNSISLNGSAQNQMDQSLLRKSLNHLSFNRRSTHTLDGSITDKLNQLDDLDCL